MKSKIFWSMVVFLSFWIAGIDLASGQTWDYNAEFSITNGNPNGVWTYGNVELANGTFWPYMDPVTYDPGGPREAIRWENSAYGSGTGPDNEGCVTKDTSGVRQDWPTWQPGQSWYPYMTGMMTPISRPAFEAIGTGARFTAPVGCKNYLVITT